MTIHKRLHHTGHAARGFFQACALLAGSAAFLAVAGAAPPKIMRLNLHAPSINPHLHGVKMISPHAALHKPGNALHPAKGGHADAAGDHPLPFRHHLWTNGWDAANWQAEHLRYGGVRGVVLNAAGRPIRNARVWLRKSGGQSFARHPRAHVVMTDAAGHFTMKHVIAEAYRLCVRTNPKGEIQHAQIAIKPSAWLPERFDFR